MHCASPSAGWAPAPSTPGARWRCCGYCPGAPWRATPAFIQFPVHPLVKEPGDPGTRLLRLQPRVFHAADFDHSPYFDVIKAPYLLDKVPSGFGALPWKGNAGALAPEQRKRHLSVVDG